ncbi:MAG TPA: CoA transferase, partial [Burkholderiaceae bacterium]
PEAAATRAGLAALLATRPAADWLALTDAADCCVTPVLRLDEVTAHPWFTGSQACGGPR